jgi:hypothetical protein
MGQRFPDASFVSISQSTGSGHELASHHPPETTTALACFGMPARGPQNAMNHPKTFRGCHRAFFYFA